ncbi:HAD-IB family hydrolase [Calidifontibacter indicus]|uniref:Putative phosphoserine phosphatase/1-acylglycerol-3-phosphate O-acyltransferase n=1 Tax=Calidifontibacter indicus TaxID=419650 RepID=A0A3D9UZZ7_9MICO|nr:HAD-IB family hydrolase [Calidifontibacter indicus]REF31534.1 putative phosphoserine phosphatase/1-acylglycerol-3-phosphate O-acyltransferase [Calidifontibacter indicus]
MAGAAFFDLDRTLLRKASGPALSRAMRESGVVSSKLPGESVLFWWMNAFGETLGSIALARQAVLVAAGKPGGAFDDAARRAAQSLVDQIGPFAKILIAQHHEAGRKVVMATTTPHHLIKPLADALGFDDVIATRYQVGDDGLYNGKQDGRFVWSWGKLASVKEWAREHDIDLSESFAYSDSIYDVPLLGAVGNPGAVNPDPRLLVVAIAKRWPILSFEAPPGTLTFPVVNLEARRLAMMLTRPETFPYVRFEINGLENIPAEGAAILAGNHRSYFDMATMAVVMGRTGRGASFLAKRELFDVPLLGPVLRMLGGVRVDRDKRDPDAADPLEEAAVALAGGDLVGVMPQGTIPRGLDFFSDTLEGYPGTARLAAMSKAPVIPFAVSGTEVVWPRSSSTPNVLSFRNPPKITVNIGTPVDLAYDSEEADTERIMAAISRILPDDAKGLKATSIDQVASTYPGGRIPQQDLPDIERAIAANTAKGRKATAKKATAKAPAKKATAKKTTAKKTTAKKTTAKKTAAKTPAKKTTAKRTAANTPAKKTTTKKTSTRKTTGDAS